MEYQLKATYKNLLSYPLLTISGESMYITWDLGNMVCVYICTKGLNLISNISGKCSYLCNSSYGLQCYHLSMLPAGVFTLVAGHQNEDHPWMDLYCIHQFQAVQVLYFVQICTTADIKNQPTKQNPKPSLIGLVLRQLLLYLRSTEGEGESLSGCWSWDSHFKQALRLLG